MYCPRQNTIKTKATRANLQVNKTIPKWLEPRPLEHTNHESTESAIIELKW